MTRILLLIAGIAIGAVVGSAITPDCEHHARQARYSVAVAEQTAHVLDLCMDTLVKCEATLDAHPILQAREVCQDRKYMDLMQ